MSHPEPRRVQVTLEDVIADVLRRELPALVGMPAPIQVAMLSRPLADAASQAVREAVRADLGQP